MGMNTEYFVKTVFKFDSRTKQLIKKSDQKNIYPGDVIKIDDECDLYLVTKPYISDGNSRRGSCLLNIYTGNLWKISPLTKFSKALNEIKVVDMNKYLNSPDYDDEYTVQYFHLGNRITFGYKRVPDGLLYTFAVCSLKDQFSRKAGRFNVDQNFFLEKRLFLLKNRPEHRYQERFEIVIDLLEKENRKQLNHIIKSKKLIQEVVFAMFLMFEDEADGEHQ